MEYVLTWNNQLTMAVTFYSNYEYIPREIEVEESQYVPTSDYLIFTTGYYHKVKAKKTVYDKYKKITNLNWFWYNLVKEIN